ncbi:MAG TPA: hypothetical protein PKA31_02855 [Candidatus Moranbacteria bacterium]|nr:hypothetical protein [Candidatus Moranbacteria bacterium]
MTPKTKMVRTVYLYLAALISLIFVAVGTGRLINTGLKYAFFTEAEKKSYFECNQQPPILGTPDLSSFKSIATDDQKAQLEQFLKDYQNWKENSTGEKCIVPARQNNVVDALTMVLIALPICLVHWRIIKKDKKNENE